MSRVTIFVPVVGRGKDRDQPQAVAWPSGENTGRGIERLRVRIPVQAITPTPQSLGVAISIVRCHDLNR